jgi:hypothetical protein
VIPLVPVITAIAAVVFVSHLLMRAFRQRCFQAAAGRHSLTTACGGRCWHKPKQPPSLILLHALGFIREGEAA